MKDAWNQTQHRLRQWQCSSNSGWALRLILSDSEYFKVIAFCSYKRLKAPPKLVSWQDWWGFHLERLDEREAIHLLLDAWNYDVLAYMQHHTRMNVNHLLGNMAEQLRLAHTFSLALDKIVAVTADKPIPPALVQSSTSLPHPPPSSPDSTLGESQRPDLL